MSKNKHIPTRTRIPFARFFFFFLLFIGWWGTPPPTPAHPPFSRAQQLYYIRSIIVVFFGSQRSRRNRPPPGNNTPGDFAVPLWESKKKRPNSTPLLFRSPVYNSDVRHRHTPGAARFAPDFHAGLDSKILGGPQFPPIFSLKAGTGTCD